MGIVRFALRFPYTFYALAALVLFLGISALTIMPIDIFPEINIPVVTVIWQYTGLSTPEMCLSLCIPPLIHLLRPHVCEDC
jgi:multidrug efflux pump subunit AcrB